MQSPAANIPTYSNVSMTPAEKDEENQEIADMEASVKAVEDLLNYRFKNKKLLEEALTHSSYTGSPSYERLEFIGDAALSLAFSKYVFLQYPGVDEGKLTRLRSVNATAEKLARVAVRHQLYKYVRHNVSDFDEKVREFEMAVQEEDKIEIYGGLVKAPDVLADIVESLAAAVYVDCNFNLTTMWMKFKDLLEPIVMLHVLEQQPHPVTRLKELCENNGKQVGYKYLTEEDKTVASVYVDGKFVTSSAPSKKKENAKLHAAKDALQKLSHGFRDTTFVNIFGQRNIGDGEIEGPKQKQHDLCGKKTWPQPIYKEEGAISLVGRTTQYINAMEEKNVKPEKTNTEMAEGNMKLKHTNNEMAEENVKLERINRKLIYLVVFILVIYRIFSEISSGG